MAARKTTDTSVSMASSGSPVYPKPVGMQRRTGGDGNGKLSQRCETKQTKKHAKALDEKRVSGKVAFGERCSDMALPLSTLSHLLVF